MDDTAHGTEGQAAAGGRLVALPRRRLDAELLASEGFVSSPTATVDDLLDRTHHLLIQLEEDIEHLKEDQEKERQRIVREAEERQAAAEAAIADLRVLAAKAHQIAQHKARTEVLEAALARDVELDQHVTFAELVTKIEEEIRLAKGITGAIRLQTIGDLLKQATLRVEHMTKQADRARERFLQETEKELRTEGKEARASYEIGMSVVRRDLKALDVALPPSGLAWDDDRWENWEGWDPLSGVSRWIRLGTYFRPQLERFRFPALFELPGETGLVLDVASGDRGVAVEAMRSILARVIASIPPGDVRFTFVDPEGLGDSVAPFLLLGEYRADLVDGGAYTLEGPIEEKLLEITKHIERVIQQHLRGEFETVEQCNAHAGEVIEPYRVLSIFDFPNQMSATSLQLLRNIIENGPRCGVYTLMTTAPGAARSNGARWKGMVGGLRPVVGDPEGYWIEHALAGRWAVDLEAPPDFSIGDVEHPTLWARILTTTGEQARRGRPTTVSQARVFELLADARRLRVREDLPVLSAAIVADDPATWWTGSSIAGLSAPIGRAGTREVACLALDSVHRPGAIVGGEVGAGVSTMLHDTVLSFAMVYPPTELALYLVDFSTRRSRAFDAFAVEALPHARVVAIGAERELGLSVLDGLVREMTRRAMLCAPHGGERAGIEGYRRETGDELPRVVLVMDAIDRLFAVDDRVRDQAVEYLDLLARQGAAYGIHLLAGTHDMAVLDGVGHRVFDRFPVRVVLACNEDESKRLLGADDGSASQFDLAGEALLGMFDAGAEATMEFQATNVDGSEREVCLRDLRRRADELGVTRRPQVVDSEAPARLEDSVIRSLGASLETQRQRRQPRFLLGEPLTLGGPVEVTLRRDRGANLLVVGDDARLGQGILFAAITSAIFGHGREIDLHVLDAMPLESGFSELLAALEPYASVHRYRRRTADEAVDAVHAEVVRRHREERFREPPVVFVLDGFGAEPVRSEPVGGAAANEQGDGPNVSPEALEHILREGPEVGVHTILWADRAWTLRQHLTRAALQALAARVVLRLDAGESTDLVDSAAASTLTADEALLYDEGSGRLTRFRPYQLPTLDFVTGVLVPAAAATAEAQDGQGGQGGASGASGATSDADAAGRTSGPTAAAPTGRSTVSA